MLDYILFFFLGCICWGASFLFSKIALQDLPFLELVAWRFSIAAIFSFIILLVKQSASTVTSGGLGKIFIYSFIMQIIPVSLIAWALREIPSGTAGLLNSLTPLMTLVLSLLSTNHRKQIKKNIVLGIILGFVGVCFIFHSNIIYGHHFSSQMAIVLATVFYGAANLFYKSYMTHIHPMATIFWMFFFQSIIAWIAVFCFQEKIVWPIGRVSTWMSLIWLGVIASSLGNIINIRLMKNLGALKASKVGYLFPISAYALGCIFLNETFSVFESIGILFIVLGIYLSSRSK